MNKKNIDTALIQLTIFLIDRKLDFMIEFLEDDVIITSLGRPFDLRSIAISCDENKKHDVEDFIYSVFFNEERFDLSFSMLKQKIEEELNKEHFR